MANKQRRTAATSIEHERLSVVDTAWLRMDAPGNPMTIVSVLTTATPVRASRLRRRITSRLARFPRFRRRPVADALGAYWHDDAAFALDAHWVDAVLPAPAGPDELQALAGRLAGEPLDPSRPLWQLHFVARYGAGSAWVLRVHHCYADGMALVRVLLSLTEPAPASVAAASTKGRRKPAGSRGADETRGNGHWPHASWLDHLALPAGRAIESAVVAGARWLETGAHRALRPEDTARFATQTRGMFDEFAGVLTLSDDPPTPLRGALSGEKRVAWTAPLDLEQIRAGGRALGCTVNDVLLATVAGALGAYLREAHGFDTTGLVLRASVPVNLRTEDEPTALGNRFGLLFVDLPVGIVDPLQRVQRMHTTMHALKGSHQPAMTLAALGVLGMLPGALQQPAIELFSRKGTLVASNVPGPREPLYLCGQCIDGLHFWVPQGGTMGLGVSVLSYAGKVSFGVIADGQRLPDPRALVRHFGHELQQTLQAAATLGTGAPRPAKPHLRQRVSGVSSGIAQPSSRRRRTPAVARRPRSPD